MALTDATKVKTFCGLPADFDGTLDPHISKASAYLKALIGSTKYTELDGLEDADPDRERADHAESLLAIYYGMPFLNLRWSPRGGMVKAVGFEASRTELMGAGEMKTYRSQFRSQALELVDAWILQDDDDKPEAFEGVIKMDAI